MASGSTIYRYSIPLDTSGGTKSPVYEVNSNGRQYICHFGSSNLTIVQEKPSPHFHRDSVNVQVEEVDKSDYEN